MGLNPESIVCLAIWLPSTFRNSLQAKIHMYVMEHNHKGNKHA